ncbi:MAG TPA: lysine exporter LysO family protein [Firmicutes bacterium]|nr:lysine exporter LysO family protein [Bacillota bacterium]
MTILILASFLAGTLWGYGDLIISKSPYVPLITQSALGLLLFTVGFDFAKGGELKEQVKGLPKIVLAVPFLTALGSLLFAGLLSPILKLSVGDGILASSGFGWYSLSAVVVSQTYDLKIGTLTLLTNVFREVLAILVIPFVAKRFGFIPAVAPGGATSLNVTLPMISRSTDGQTTLIAIYSGSLVSAMVPFLVPLLIQLIKFLA